MTPPHTRRVRPVLLATLAAVALALVLPACGSDTSDAGSADPTTSAAPTTTTTTPEPAYRSWIANVSPEVDTVAPLDGPDGAPLELDTDGDGSAEPVEVTNPLPSGAPTTFLIAERGPVVDGVAWYRVHLPVRPNGSTGWISGDQVTLTHTDMAATIDLADHELTLSDAGAVVATYPVAVGEAETPTPTGAFYVKELVEPTNGGGAYGPIAYGLSAFSPTLVDTEAFADGVIGIHGTNRPDLIGTDVSHGCVRMRNDDILDLERRQVPLGMPVEIR